MNVVESARAARARAVVPDDGLAATGSRPPEAVEERFKAGDLTSIDAIQTEQRVTRSQLDSLGARLSLASLAARIRYEAGLLLPYSISAGEVSFARGGAAPPGRQGAMNPTEGLFRKSALEKLSSPEQLDVTMQVTSPMGWITLAGISVLLVFATVWSIVGSIGDQGGRARGSSSAGPTCSRSPRARRDV